MSTRRFDWRVARRHGVPIVVTAVVLLVSSGFMYGLGRTGALSFQLPPMFAGVKLDVIGILALCGVVALFGFAMYFGAKTNGLLSAVIIGAGLLIAAALGIGVMTSAGASLPMLILALAPLVAFAAVVGIVHLGYMLCWSGPLQDKLLELRDRLRHREH